MKWNGEPIIFPVPFVIESEQFEEKLTRKSTFTWLESGPGKRSTLTGDVNCPPLQLTELSQFFGRPSEAAI